MRRNYNSQEHAASTIAGSVLATLLTIFLPLGCAQASSREKIVRQNPCPLSQEDEYGYSFSLSHRASPLPPFLESVLLEEASKEYVTAATDWLNARSAYVEAQNRLMSTHPNADKERLEVASKLINLDSADLTALKTQLSKLCAEIIDLRCGGA